MVGNFHWFLLSEDPQVPSTAVSEGPLCLRGSLLETCVGCKEVETFCSPFEVEDINMGYSHCPIREVGTTPSPFLLVPWESPKISS